MPARRLPGNPVAQQFLLWLLRRLMRLLLRCEVVHLEHFPARGPVVVIINHIHLFDPFVALGVIPRLVIPMAKSEAFDWFLAGAILKICGIIPVRRGQADVRAIKLALRVLRAGAGVLLAPEGTRSPNGVLLPGRDGAVLIALRSAAAIVPVGITGTDGVKSYWLKLRRAPVRVSVGEPFRLQPVSGSRIDRAEIKLMTRALMGRLARELPEHLRGMYLHPDPAAEACLLPVE